MLAHLLTATLLLLAPAALTNPPYPYPNSTFSNTTSPTQPSNLTAITIPNSTTTTPAAPCQTAHATTLQHLLSRNPTLSLPPTRFFMILRQGDDAFQVATQVQFTALPPDAYACRLELLLPAANMTSVYGPNPLVNVYQVEREAGAPATWEDYVGDEARWNTTSTGWNNTNNTVKRASWNKNTYIGGARRFDTTSQMRPEVFGQVNGTPEALEKTRENGGVAVVNTTQCRETLTFQMGFASPGAAALVNYWDFVNVVPPASPVQGWRVVHSC